MHTPTELTDQSFDDAIQKHPLVLVDFWAEWCGPCRMIAPIVEELAQEYHGKALVAKVNVDHSPSVSSRFGVRSIPTLLFIKDGKEVDKQVGVVGKKTIVERLNKHLTGN